MRILVSDSIAEEGLNILKEEKAIEVAVNTKLKPDELKEVIKDFDALVVRSSTKVTRDIIENASRLKVIGRAGTGLDNVDADAATKKGIIVMNTPGGNTISTAEHTFSLILALSRKIPQAVASIKRGEWDRKSFMGIELFQKVLGILGLGRIGSEVAKRAISFGMKPVAFDPYLSEETAKEIEVELVDFEKLLKISDYITVHTPLSNETRYIIDEEEFKLMKDGARIINCARGGIINERALYSAITSGKIAGAALDVLEEEPPKDNPLLKLENVIITPHLGASTEEAQISVAIDIARQVLDALLGRGIRNAVNVPCVEGELLKHIKPFIELAEKTGLLISQIAEGRIREVKIRYSGDITAHDIKPVTIALVKGLLSPVLMENVNYVNATCLAKERGINITESKLTQIEDFVNLIAADVITDKSRCSVYGTLFANKEPRIVKINEFYVDLIPSGSLLVISNIDKPGIVGYIGTLMGSHNINIANMTFGRVVPGGKAITVLNLDNVVPREILDEVKKGKNIIDAKLIKL
ncbi:MAG: phosphoglycerate dehydrogenase [Candidatus Omnitrophica bacterium]|nr:phosphoglycerate dehydrogenase [Candidatus Omnitrophota bacterium]